MADTEPSIFPRNNPVASCGFTRAEVTMHAMTQWATGILTETGDSYRDPGGPGHAFNGCFENC